MKKALIPALAVLGLLHMAGAAYAQSNVPSVAPITKTPAGKPPVAQQDTESLDSCQTKFQKQNIPQSQYHTFMDSCMGSNTSGSGMQTSTPPSKLPTLAPTLTVTPPTPAAPATTK